jgi:hypothetical protein
LKSDNRWNSQRFQAPEDTENRAGSQSVGLWKMFHVKRVYASILDNIITYVAQQFGWKIQMLRIAALQHEKLLLFRFNRPAPHPHSRQSGGTHNEQGHKRDQKP